ncbi:tetratricopeptide repeat protein [Shewanella sp. 1180_01]|uniref:tetratricopeptide repeat protein n=1 Tax=Shewanella sp. 1180_01 TaxID=2604451 RepID=UPI004063AE33
MTKHGSNVFYLFSSNSKKRRVHVAFSLTLYRILSFFILLNLVSGCVSHSSVDELLASKSLVLPVSHSALFNTQTIPVPSVDSLSSLTSEQRTELNDFIRRKEIEKLSPRKQVVEFISSKMQHFNYEGRNYIASEALRTQSGNCMSLALLTYAVANILNVETTFQVIHSSPLLTDIKDDLVVSSDHVRVFLSESAYKGHYLSGGNHTVIDYFPDVNDRAGAIVSEKEFLAMFYRNLAVDALLEGDLSRSFAMLERGVLLAPKYSPVINMMAILHRRAGDYDTSRDFYKYGLEIADSQVVLLSNYRQLLRQVDDKKELSSVEAQLLALNDSTPYEWYGLGLDALKSADYKKAQIYLKKFLNNTPYFHRAYYDLARAQFALGDIRSAQESLHQALELAKLPDNLQMYKAKLQWLSQQNH